MILCFVQKKGKFRILAECDDDLQCELLSFLGNLEGNLAKHAIGMLNLLERVAKEGPPHRTEVSHHIEDGIWQFEHGRIRILWFYDEGCIIICSHGFVKSTRRTPRGEIDRAKNLCRRYFEAKARREIDILEDEGEG